MATGPAGDFGRPATARFRVSLLGPFAITLGERSAGPWARPSAKRLCELVMLSPGRRVGREAVGDVLFANLGPAAAANAFSKALSMARAALIPLGEEASKLLRADRAHIWVPAEVPVELDLVIHENALRAALSMGPGVLRDEALSAALTEDRALLEDEPYADWAIRPREALELLRQRARLELARDRTSGRGRAQPGAVVDAWENCLSHDPTSEEAASALMRLHAAQGRHQLAATTFERCRVALEAMGLRVPPALEEARRSLIGDAPRAMGARPEPAPAWPSAPRLAKEERRLVSVLFAELAAPVGVGRRLDPEDLREVVGGALAEVIAEVEGLGGLVTSVSGAGLVALFGAPEAHEDDPERAVRAGYRVVSAIGGHDSLSGAEGLSVRIGVETGRAVVGPLATGATVNYGAVGEVVAVAAALQSAARSGSVLVGPVTRAATEEIFEWGPTEEVAPSPSAKPLACSYLERPKARSLAHHGQRRFGSHTRLVGRQAELSVLDEAVRAATAGTGSIAFVVGEPGLGKSRLVQECRARFMAWVGAGTGRLPLWLEGRGASYASSTPYGLYQQLLSAWIGVAPDESDEVVRPALGRALKAMFGTEFDHVDFLAHLMGLRAGSEGARLARLSPEGLQRATFAAMRAVVARLVAAGPTVLVLEDLHWADPTSLRLTEEVAALARDGPLLLVATRRPEPDAGVPAFERAVETDAVCPVRKVELSPLPASAERELARSLVGRAVGEDVVQAVCTNVEGNPLFLEERLFSLIETGALTRDGAGWSFRASGVSEVPDALERLIRSRVDRLRPPLREAIAAASVLGPEFSQSALGAVTGTDDELPAVLGELCTTGLLWELRQLPEPVFRFRHALIQEATYQGMLRAQRRQLHARAAWGLEAVSADRLEEVAAVLGRHFALGGEVGRAVHYLEIAGDHAAKAFANDEAIASYRDALAIMDRADATTRQAAVQLRANLANVLWLTGRHSEARVALREALGLVDSAAPGGPLQAARLYARLGRVEVADHNYDAGLASFDAAEGLLGGQPADHDEDQAVVDLRLEIEIDGRATLHYWRNEPTYAAVALARARPLLEARGTPARKQSFYLNMALQRAREARYRIDDDILVNARAAVAAAQDGGDERDVAWTVFCLGFFLLWHGDLAEAEEHLKAALGTVEHIGDVVLRARCLCYLNVTALRRHDVGAVRALAPQAMEAAEAASYPEYVAAARATQAWVAWREDRRADVVDLATEALRLWDTTVVSYSWYWLCLWPLIAVYLSSGQVAKAVEASRRILVPTQQRLPDELQSQLESAGAAWDGAGHTLAAGKLAGALELAWDLGYA
ncbi:MAG TPA: AAA family ATPase [Acidimicrobiales bacterium]|nr:AAA family ATPase [Acidimicrobiales bacterium]